MENRFKLKPFEHQAEEFKRHKDDLVRALLWDRGTGKTKAIIDLACYLYEKNEIRRVLIVAPNGVHRQWIDEQLPIHCWDNIEWKGFKWDGQKSKTLKAQKEIDLLLSPSEPLKFLTINYEALATKKGEEVAKKFLVGQACLFVCDESHKIKTPRAERTKAINRLGKLAEYKRILTGTVVANGAFDLYSQFSFLDPEVLGFKSFYAFKTYFGVFKKAYAKGGRIYDHLLGYRNLEKLTNLIDPVSSRIVKDEVLDIPPKLYQKVYTELTASQARIYNQIKEDFRAELKSGKVLSVPLAITRLLRLQQIICGYLPTGNEMILWKDNPRVKTVLEILEDCPGKIIIWARFKQDIRNIRHALDKANYKVVEYHGDVNAKDRDAAVDDFQNNPEVKIFLANPAAAGEGLNLFAATTEIYYSNSFKLVERLQSEDRAHRPGQTKNVTIIDIIAAGTVDERIVDTLRKKNDIASKITGEDSKEWI